MTTSQIKLLFKNSQIHQGKIKCCRILKKGKAKKKYCLCYIALFCMSISILSKEERILFKNSGHNAFISLKCFNIEWFEEFN